MPDRYRWAVPSQRSRMQNAGKVAFVFGACEATVLPGPVLIRMLGRLGMEPAAAKTLLGRMRQAGMVTVERSGRVGRYRMTGRFADRFDQLAGRAEAEWDGRLYALVYDIAESRRQIRRHLLQRAEDEGYAQLRPGLWVCCWDRGEALRAELQRVRSRDLGYLCSLTADPVVATEMITRAFGLAELGRMMNLRAERLERLAAEGPPDDDHLMMITWRSVASAVELQVRESNVPTALLPKDWAGKRLSDAVNGLYAAWEEAADRLIRKDIAAHPHGELVEYWPDRDAH